METNTPVYTFEMVWQGLMENREQIKELTKNVYGISRSNGMMSEESIYNVLERDMTFAGVRFDVIEARVPIKDEKFRTLTDLDIVMHNSNVVAIVEVKYKVDKKDVRELITKKLHYFKQYFPLDIDYKIILGVGGMSFDDEAIEEAKRNGVGIIKVVGDKIEYHTEGIKTY